VGGTSAEKKYLAGGRPNPNTLPREGGLPIFADGKFLGAIGVSGGTSSEDAQVAEAGVDALKK
jgi:glc operon protein GlcG